VIGAGMGAAVFGALFGPVVGAAAAVLGRAPVFAALAGLGVVLAAWALRLQGVPGGRPSTAAVARALRNRRFVGGLLLMSLPALLFGVLGVLGPLHLAAAGWGAAAIGAVWLCSAALESLQAPLVGRLIDRRGRLLPVRVSLVGSVLCSIGLATGARPIAYVPLIVFSGLMYGALFTPAFALIADGAEEAGLAQGMAFGVMNAAWAIGALAGPAASGAIAGATGDTLPFLLAAGLCGATLLLVRGRRWERRRPAPLVDRA
jgi:MFS family permease